MGMPKATLPFGPELMLPRVVRLLSQVVAPLVIVAAPDQELPPLPAGVLIARDRRGGRGPLEGLFAGLSKLRDGGGLALTDAAYATSCDVPLLHPQFVRRMIEELGEHDVALPVEENFAHPLAAVYRLTVISRIEQLLAADRLRPAFLFEQIATRRVPVEALRTVDPNLDTLRNLNFPADYLAALQIAGFSPPPKMKNEG